MAITVTATQTNGSNGMVLHVTVLTGAAKAAAQTGNSTNNQFASTTAFSQSITTTAGSNVYGAASHGSGVTDSGNNTTVIDSVDDATNGWHYSTFKALNVTGGATTRGLTISLAVSGPFAQQEILASGTLAEDASSPASVSTTSATTVTTASFTPPPGSLLVAMVGSNGGAGVTTMTVSGGGLVWSEKVKNNPSGGDYAGVWIADVPPAAGGLSSAQPGQTWLRRFHHRQVLPYASAAVAAAPAAVPVFFQPPLRNPRAASRGHLGRMGACAAGILAVTTLSPQPTAVPPAHPAPAIQHLAPHRATGKGILAPPQLARLTAKLPPTAISPRPAHRAQWRGILAKTTYSPQPSIVNVLPQPVPIRRPGPHRVLWRGVAGPAPVAVAVTAVPPARPAPVTNRPPAPHRALVRGVLAATTLAPQPARVPPPQWRQPPAPRPAHRGLWRAVAGPAPAAIAAAPAAPARPAPVTNRPPAPHRAITRRALAPPAPLVQPSRPAPTINRPPPPHRAVIRWVLAKTTLAAQPTRVPGPLWRQPNAPRPAHRGLWRRITGAAPPPPPFTIGALTASTTATATQAPADRAGNALTGSTAAPGALTAATAPAGGVAYGSTYGAVYGPGEGVLTASDTRTGGPS